jgi:hypothetical protein
MGEISPVILKRSLSNAEIHATLCAEALGKPPV